MHRKAIIGQATQPRIDRAGCAGPWSAALLCAIVAGGLLVLPLAAQAQSQTPISLAPPPPSAGTQAAPAAGALPPAPLPPGTQPLGAPGVVPPAPMPQSNPPAQAGTEPPPVAVQTSPLAPLPGAALPQQPTPQAPSAAINPNDHAPPGAPLSGPTPAPAPAPNPAAPSPAAPNAPAENTEPATPPEPWIAKTGAVLRVLDKVNAISSELTVPDGQTVTYGSLSITVKACAVRPPDRPEDATAFLVITDSHPGAPGFTGWMFRDEPSLSMLQSPIYDVRVVSCQP